jgi:hypothetical protein
MYTRAALAAGIARSAAIYKRRSVIMAVIAVVGGVGQLALHRVIEARMERSAGHRIELMIFAIYMLAVVPLFLWLLQVKKIAPRCEACGAAIMDTTARMALATGRCDQCGAQIVE